MMRERGMMTVFSRLVETFFDRSKVIPLSRIPFDSEVRRLCEQNMCGNYGKSWTCPPAVGPLEALRSRLSDFDKCFVFCQIYSLEDSFDWHGMMSGVRDFQKRIFSLKKEIQNKAPLSDIFFLGAGSCQLCDICTYPQGEPCRNPDGALFSIESFGIDAMKMMKENGLKYNNGPNTVTYIGLLFYH
jgi:predicted metal-binding protein